MLPPWNLGFIDILNETVRDIMERECLGGGQEGVRLGLEKRGQPS
jgi:hypothetical protein